MADIAPLGFAVDTTQLEKAKRAAKGLTDELNKLGKESEKTEKVTGKETKAHEENTKAKDKGKRSSEEGARATDRARQSTERATSSLQRQAQQQANLNAAMQRTQGAVNGLAGAMGAGGLAGGGLGAAAAGVSARLGGVAAAGGLLNPVTISLVASTAALFIAYDKLLLPLARVEDKFSRFEARLANISVIGARAGETMRDLGGIADQIGTSFDGIIDSFARMARNSAEIGATKGDMLELVEVVAKLGVVSGASQGEIASGTIQLSQALAAGRLNGDELRSIMENMPALAKAIAEGLGVGVGQLRAMGAAGELTSDKVFKALLGQLDKVNVEFANMPQTTERSLARLNNAFDRFSNRMAEAFSASRIAQSIIDGVAEAVDFVDQAIAPTTAIKMGAQLQQAQAELKDALRELNRPGMIENSIPFRSAEARVESLTRKIDRLRQELRAAEFEGGGTVGGPSDPEIRAQGRINRAAIVARDADQLTKKTNKLEGQVRTLEEALADLADGFGDLQGDERAAQIDLFTRMLAALQIQLANTLSPLQKFNQATRDTLDGVGRFGGGGGSALLGEARGLVRSSATRGSPISEAQALNAVFQKRTADIQVRTVAIESEIAKTAQLSSAVRLTGEAALEAQAHQERLNLEFSLFGENASMIARAANLMDKFEAATLRSMKAQRALNVEQQLFQQSQERANIERQRGDVGLSPFEQRLSDVRAQALIADRDAPGVGAGIVSNFRLQTQLDAERQAAAIRRQTARTRQLAGLAGNPGRQRATERGFAREDAAAQFGRLEGADVAAALEAQDAANDNRSHRERLAISERRLALLKAETKAVEKVGVEREVELARVRKLHELASSGVPISQATLEAELKIVEAVTRQEEARRKAQEAADRMLNLIDDSAAAIGNTLEDALETAFETGRLRGRDLLNLVGGLASEIRNKLLRAMIIDPFTSFLSTFGSRIAGSLFGGLGGSAAGAAGSTAVGAPTVAGISNLIPIFHQGGVVGRPGESRAVNPLVFAGAQRLHTGGMAGGFLGSDEVPIIARRGERIVPEGGAANDGGVIVQIIDQRGAGGDRVSVEEGTPIDGKRLLRVMIRDEVKNQLGEGELDRTLKANFGISRPVQRR